MAKIFICYRREFDDFLVLNISEKLRGHFGDDSVFLDTDNIPLGVDFREHLDNEVGKCDILLAIISKQWINVTNEQGERRLDDAGDFVRIEIESAISRKIPVVPVLVNETRMPAAADLPESLKKLVFLQATVIRSGQDFHFHIERLIRGLEPHLKPKEKPPEETKITALQVIEPEIETSEDKKPVENKRDKKALHKEYVANRQDQRSRVMQIIKEGLNGFTDSSMWLGKAIPRYKLLNAIGAYAQHVSTEDVLLLHDDTVMGSAKDGMILTTDALYNRIWLADPVHLPYTKIKSVEATQAPNPFDKNHTIINTVLINKRSALALSQGENPSEKRRLIADIIRRLAGL